ncbi:MAG: nitroreductase family protein [Candidatus Marinimicrobia bacterium]|nr:nitroreductase family protein [Candidatus Neomarinimicrobiota bacterium]
MTFLDLIKTRQSDRKYLDKPVEKEKIERCLEAARLAPSATNSQPWEFIVVSNPDLKNKVAHATYSSLIKFNRWVPTAPVLVVLNTWKPELHITLGGILKNRQFNLIDVGIVAEHFCLQAAEEGLGTCMLGWFQTKKIMKLLNIKAPKKPALVITLGYSGHTHIRDKKRKNLDEIRKYM